MTFVRLQVLYPDTYPLDPSSADKHPMHQKYLRLVKRHSLRRMQASAISKPSHPKEHLAAAPRE